MQLANEIQKNVQLYLDALFTQPFLFLLSVHTR